MFSASITVVTATTLVISSSNATTTDSTGASVPMTCQQYLDSLSPGQTLAIAAALVDPVLSARGVATVGNENLFVNALVCLDDASASSSGRLLQSYPDSYLARGVDQHRDLQQSQSAVQFLVGLDFSVTQLYGSDAFDVRLCFVHCSGLVLHRFLVEYGCVCSVCVFAYLCALHFDHSCTRS